MEYPICLAPRQLFSYPKPMEVHFAPETEQKLKNLAEQTGRKTADELVQDVIAGYFDEIAQTGTMLDRRYDDLKSGEVKPIPGDEVENYFRNKSAAARRSQPGS
jgi:predicted DNA-binding protein